MASKHRMAIFAAHTNLDKVADGVNDVLAHRIGLKNLKALAKDRESDDKIQGLGRIGELENRIGLASFASEIKKSLGIKTVRVAGNPDMLVKKVAVCAGSGSGLMDIFFSSGAQVYISGDLRYHDARAAEASRVGLIDIGHFTSEHLIVEILAERLKKLLVKTGIDIEVKACGLETDPFKTI